MIAQLIAEAKKLIADVENDINRLKAAEPTQLALVVRRLELFLQMHAHVGSETVEPVVEPADEPEGEPEAEAAKPARRKTAKSGD